MNNQNNSTNNIAKGRNILNFGVLLLNWVVTSLILVFGFVGSASYFEEYKDINKTWGILYLSIVFINTLIHFLFRYQGKKVVEGMDEEFKAKEDKFQKEILKLKTDLILVQNENRELKENIKKRT